MFKRLSPHFLWLLAILVVAAVLRFYQLGQVPHGMTWDEAAIGYNGHAVLTTRRDEWLKRLPISFRSFGDYKAPAAIYLNGFSTILLGNSLFAVRLPFALFSLLAILGLYILSYEVLTQQSLTTQSFRQTGIVSLVATAAMAISPWHFHFSRVGFESGIALALVIWGIALLLKGGRLEKWGYLAAGIVLIVASLYTYHSTKIAVPLLLLLVGWFAGWRKLLRARYWPLLLGGVILLLPLIIDLFWGQGLTRANTLLLSQHLPPLTLVLALAHNWMRQLSMDFLFFGWTDTLRHGTGKWGVLYLLDLVPLLWLMARVVTSNLKSVTLPKLGSLRAITFWTGWLIIGLLPAVLGDLTPHANRALLALPGFLVLGALGWQDALEVLRIPKAGMLICIAYIVLSASFIHYYFTTYARTSAIDFTDGYLEAAQIATDIEKNGWKGVLPEKILFTADYGQPYIFILFVKNLNPIWYQGGALVKYEFTDTISVGDLARPKTLVVASGSDDIPLDWANQVVKRSDGSVAFKIYYPKETP